MYPIWPRVGGLHRWIAYTASHFVDFPWFQGGSPGFHLVVITSDIPSSLKGEEFCNRACMQTDAEKTRVVAQ